MHFKTFWNWIKEKVKILIKNSKEYQIADVNNKHDEDETKSFDSKVGTIMKDLFSTEFQEIRKEYDTIKIKYKIKEKEFELDLNKNSNLTNPEATNKEITINVQE